MPADDGWGRCDDGVDGATAGVDQAGCLAWRSSMADTSQLVEYAEGEPFPGRIGKTVEQSSPAWPAPNRAKPGAPNVVVFMLDDVGFGQMSPFGGLIETPTLDRLAEAGLRYTNFQTTALSGNSWRPSSCPTRLGLGAA